MYEGEPILAVAADSEELAAAAIEAIRVDLRTARFRHRSARQPAPRRPQRPHRRQRVRRRRGEDDQVDRRAARARGRRRVPDRRRSRRDDGVGRRRQGLHRSRRRRRAHAYQQSTSHQPLESRTAMAYWQNGKLYLHGSTQSVSRTVASVAGWVGIPQKRRRRHQRVLRRRLRQQDPRRADDGDSGAAVEEAERPPGDDAHLARGRDLHRPHAPRLPGVGEDGLQEGRPRHRDRRLHHRGQRSVSRPGRQRAGGEPRDAALSGAERTLPRLVGRHQHAAARLAARAGRAAERDSVRAAGQQGRQAARHRSGRDSQDQRAGQRLAVRPQPGGAGRAAAHGEGHQLLSSRKRSIAAPSSSTGKSGRSTTASATAPR